MVCDLSCFFIFESGQEFGKCEKNKKKGLGKDIC